MAVVHSDQGSDSLRRFAREHHVSYEVEEDPPAAMQGGSMFEVRLFATHGEDKLEAPMCPRCVELAHDLRSFATGIVASSDAASWSEIMDPSPALYTATDQRGPDEVSLAVRVWGESPNQRTASDGHLRRVEDSLKGLGIPRR